jgi:hypothetical protein
MKGVVHTMFVSKLKLAAAACIGVAVAGGVTTTVIHQALAKSSTAAVAMTATVAGDSADAADPSEQYAASLPGGRTVEILGITDIPATKDSWRAIDGAKITHQASPFDRHEVEMAGATRAILCRMTGADASYDAKVSGGKLGTQYILDGAQNEAFWCYPILPDAGRNAVDLELLVADGEWQTLCEGKNRPGHGLGIFETPEGGVAFTHLMDHPNGGSMVYVAHEHSERAWRFCAIDINGQLHSCDNIDGDSAGKLETIMVRFALVPDQIASIVAQTRGFNRKVSVKNIALDAAHPSKPQIEVGEIKESK